MVSIFKTQTMTKFNYVIISNRKLSTKTISTSHVACWHVHMKRTFAAKCTKRTGHTQI